MLILYSVGPNTPKSGLNIWAGPFVVELAERSLPGLLLLLCGVRLVAVHSPNPSNYLVRNPVLCLFILLPVFLLLLCLPLSLDTRVDPVPSRFTLLISC